MLRRAPQGAEHRAGGAAHRALHAAAERNQLSFDARIDRGFDIELRWNPGPGQLAPAKPGPDDAPPIDRSGPSLSVAIEEQLGLRFRAAKGMTEHFTVVAVERPRDVVPRAVVDEGRAAHHPALGVVADDEAEPAIDVDAEPSSPSTYTRRRRKSNLPILLSALGLGLGAVVAVSACLPGFHRRDTGIH